MHVLTVCYGHPADPAAFDSYYASTHAPLAEKIPGLASFTAATATRWTVRSRLTTCSPSSASPRRRRWAPPWPRPRDRRPPRDVPNFATGGVTMFVAYD